MTKSNTIFPIEWYNDNYSKPHNFNPSTLLSPPPNSLSSFSDSIDHLVAAISSTPTPTDSSRDAYLNSTISLLNMCNTISAQIERFKLGSLRLKFVHHLLSSPSAKHLSCARKELSEWTKVLSTDTDLDFSLDSVEEIEKTNVAVRRLCGAIDSGDIASEELRVAVVKMEILAEELTVGLDRLATAVNNLFSVVMCSRNMLLDSYKVGPKKCK